MVLLPMNPRYRHKPDTGIGRRSGGIAPGNLAPTVVCDSVLH